MKKRLGVTTPSIVGLKDIPTNDRNTAQAMRLLYRLRVSGEQRPFDTTSLFYILPMVLLTMNKGGLGAESQDEVDEQVVLALDFIAFHTQVCMSLYFDHSLSRSLTKIRLEPTAATR